MVIEVVHNRTPLLLEELNDDGPLNIEVQAPVGGMPSLHAIRYSTHRAATGYRPEMHNMENQTSNGWNGTHRATADLRWQK